jgi:hypothetical protein
VVRFPDAANQPFEMTEITAVENSFLGTQAENNLRFTVETSRLGCEPGARELQTTTTERHLRGRQAGDFGLRHQRSYKSDWLGETPLDFTIVNATD